MRTTAGSSKPKKKKATDVDLSRVRQMILKRPGPSSPGEPAPEKRQKVAEAVAAPSEYDPAIDTVRLAELFPGVFSSIVPASLGPREFASMPEGRSEPVDTSIPPLPFASERGKDVAEGSDRGRPEAEPAREADFARFYHESGFRNAFVARELIKAVILPQDWDLTMQNRVLDVRRSIYQSILEFIHRLALIEEGADIQMVELKNEVQNAIAEREVAEELRASAEAKLTKQLGINKLLEDSNRQLGRGFRDLEEKCNKYLGRLKKKKRLLAEAKAEISAMTEDHAREISAMAEDHVRKISEVDQQIKLAFEEGQEKGTDAFRSSEDYQDDLARAGVQSYRGGFDDALGAVAARYPDIDLSGLRLPEPPEEPEDEDEEGTSTPEAPDAPVAPVESAVLPIAASNEEEPAPVPEDVDTASTAAGSSQGEMTPVAAPEPVEVVETATATASPEN